MDSAGRIWVDGELVDWDDATTHVLTHALNHGTAVFEGIRCYATPDGPALFRLEDHMARLGRSARALLMDLPYTRAELCDAAAGVVAANGLGACYLRMVAQRGYGEMGINCDNSPVQCWVAAWEQAPSFDPELAARGLSLTISSWQRGNPNVIPPAAKVCGSYVTASLARAEAVRAGFDDALLLAPNGNVSEATIQNLFALVGDTLVTPPLSDGPLPGITRRTVIELAADLGIPCVEQSLTRADVYAADELLLCGTGAEIVAVGAVDGRRFDTERPITRAIQDAYRRATRGDDAARARGWLHPVSALAAAA